MKPKQGAMEISDASRVDVKCAGVNTGIGGICTIEYLNFGTTSWTIKVY
jgi:hypothetical protein